MHPAVLSGATQCRCNVQNVALFASKTSHEVGMISILYYRRQDVYILKSLVAHISIENTFTDGHHRYMQT